MKGIYLTQEGKQEIEAKIAELEKHIKAEKNCESPIEYLLGEWKGKQFSYKEILLSTTILPVEESWRDLGENSGTLYHDDADVLDSYYPNGVIIIKPKES